MLLWFAGLTPLLVRAVFQSGGLDTRFLVIGALLPLADGVAGGAGALHTLLAAVVALAGVMVLTRRRRLVRRRWLGIPIGMFAHLVLDGVWARTELFWWPLAGADLAGESLPELDRPMAVLVLMELVGLAALLAPYTGRRR